MQAIKHFFGMSSKGNETLALVAYYGHTSPHHGIVIRANGIPLPTTVESVTQAQAVIDHLNKRGRCVYTYTVYTNTQKGA